MHDPRRALALERPDDSERADPSVRGEYANVTTETNPEEKRGGFLFFAVVASIVFALDFSTIISSFWFAFQLERRPHEYTVVHLNVTPNT